ncbi:MAG: hypothetical protein RL065_955 [Bacteroidota bacterium]
MKDKITVIIPAYNRPIHLQRTIEYASLLPYSFIIVDDSPTKPIIEKTLPSNVSYYYFHQNNFYDKVSFAISKTNTPYVMLCADDDFHLQSGVKTGIDFLDTHSDYSCVHGVSLSFYKLKNAVLYNSLYSYGNNIDNVETEIFSRAKKYFSPFYPNYYSIHRIENLNDVFKYKMKYEVLGLIEFIFSFSAAIHGKFKVLPVVFHLREEAAFSAGNTTPLLPDIAIDEKSKHIFSDFKETLIKFYSEKTSSNENKARIEVEAIIKSYLDWVKTGTQYHSVFSYAYLKRKYLKPLLPSFFSFLVKMKKQKQANSNHNQKLFAQLNLQKNSINLNDIKQIEDLIIQFNN